MTLDHSDLINSIMSSLDRLEYIKAAEIPNIDLYMDQVTTFMEERLKNTTRNPGIDKVLTKTMINNYVKNNVMPAPNKKKYSKEHMYILIVIYYFKNVLSINDIDVALNPIREKYCGDSKDFKLEDVYEGIRTTAEKLTESIKDDLLDTYRVASDIFPEAKEDDKETEEFKSNLKFIIDCGWSKNLIETYYSLHGKQLPIFEASNKNKNDLNLIIYTEQNRYLLRDSYYSCFSSYLNDTLLLIQTNQRIPQKYKQALSFVLKFVFEKYILLPLQQLKEIQENIMSFSAYRGMFFDDKDSQASLAFKELIKKFSFYLTTKHKRKKGVYSFGEVFYEDEISLLKKWLKNFEIGEGLTMDYKQFEIFKVIIEKGLERYPVELGFGNQQLLPLILGMFSNPCGIFFIEEPESHLHPYMQSKLGDFFTDMLNYKIGWMKGEKPQLIIETHSEYLIRRLQYLVANRSIGSEDVAIYYINKADRIPAEARQIQKMEILKDGSLGNDFGPGFFDEAINLKLELLKLKNPKKK